MGDASGDHMGKDQRSWTRRIESDPKYNVKRIQITEAKDQFLMHPEISKISHMKCQKSIHQAQHGI